MKQEILKIIKQGENEKAEFKESFSDETVETLVAFANSKGGRVLLGVNDKQKIIGVKTGKESLQKIVNEVKQKTDYKIIPEIEALTMNSKTIIVLSISEYPSKPLSFKGKYYKRVNNSNHLMAVDEVVDEYLRVRNKSWDMFLAEDAALSDLDFNKVSALIKRINQKREAKIEEDPLSFLKKFDLMHGEKITNAARLLFSKKPLFFTEIQIGLFETDTVIKKSITIKDDLLSEVDQVMDFIMARITKEYIITGKPEREERWQYPLSAIREFVVNAIVHRDYRSGVHSQFKVFRDKLILWNIGKLPNSLTIKDLYLGAEESTPRNIKIAEIFKEAGLIEKYGSGIKRAVNEIIDYGLPRPKISEMAGGIDVEILGEKAIKKDMEKVGEKVGKKVGENEARILNLISENKNITYIQLAKKLNITEKSIYMNVEKLKQKGLLKRIGPAKGGHWEVKK